MGTTSHGGSVVNDFLNQKLHHSNITGWESNGGKHNSTYRVLVGLVIWSSGGGGQENYVMFGNSYWWLSSSVLGRWNQWDSLCIGINLETPSLVLYHNGKM